MGAPSCRRRPPISHLLPLWPGCRILCLLLGLGVWLMPGSEAARAAGPHIVAVTPPAHTNDPGVTGITLEVSEPVVAAGALDLATYTLLGLGEDRELGGGDDSEVGLTPSYTPGATQIILQLAATLPEGIYQLTARGGVEDGLRDLAGDPLDQDQDGTPDDLVTMIDVDLTSPVVTGVELGTALSFDGDYDCVALPGAALDGTNDLTVELWFRTRNTGNQALLSAARTGDTNALLLWLQSGSLTLDRGPACPGRSAVHTMASGTT